VDLPLEALDLTEPSSHPMLCRVPVVLRELGILKYKQALSQKVGTECSS
jgi:hypothetical protein